MAKDRNSRGRFRQKTTRKPVGGRDLRGDLDDDGRFAKCGYCGFINALDRTDVGGDSSLPNISYEKTIILSDVFYENVATGKMSYGASDFTLPTKSVTFFVPTVNQFCALCGSPNWYK